MGWITVQSDVCKSNLQLLALVKFTVSGLHCNSDLMLRWGCRLAFDHKYHRLFSLSKEIVREITQWVQALISDSATSNNVWSQQHNNRNLKIKLQGGGRELFPLVYSSGRFVLNSGIRTPWTLCDILWPVTPPVWPSWAVTHSRCS